MLKILPYNSPVVACYPSDPQAVEVARLLIDMIQTEVQEVKVEHVGSSSVPGCAGKGHIDLMVLYPDGTLEATKAGLAALGFQAQTTRDPFPEERPMRVGQFRYEAKDYPVHAHVIAVNSAEVEILRSFREMLKADENLREQYVETKKKILTDGISDSVDYAERKSKFVEAVLSKSRDRATNVWSESSGDCDPIGVGLKR